MPFLLLTKPAMRTLFLLLTALLLGSPAMAQLPLLTAAPAPDTVAALHRLFAAKRRTISVALPLTAGIGTGLFVVAAQTHDIEQGVGWTLMGFAAMAAVISGLFTIPRYAKKT